jgi:hypothetical protein
MGVRRRSEHIAIEVDGVPTANDLADVRLREQVAAAGVRALMRSTNLSQHTLEAIRAGRRVRNATLARLRSIL